MIKANELRIGNKLQKENGEAYTVSRIDNTQDVLVEEQRGLLTLNYNLFGITLTPEILEKCGFEKGSIYFYFPKFRIAKIENSDNWIILFSNSDLPICRFQHLHQLQNLYFALMGEELIFKKESY